MNSDALLCCDCRKPVPARSLRAGSVRCARCRSHRTTGVGPGDGVAHSAAEITAVRFTRIELDKPTLAAMEEAERRKRLAVVTAAGYDHVVRDGPRVFDVSYRGQFGMQANGTATGRPLSGWGRRNVGRQAKAVKLAREVGDVRRKLIGSEALRALEAFSEVLSDDQVARRLGLKNRWQAQRLRVRGEKIFVKLFNELRQKSARG